MAKRAGRHPVEIAVAVLVGIAIMATIMGCTASALTPFGTGDEAGMRLSGGSCPGGQKVCGYALRPFSGVSARGLGDELWELADGAVVTLQGPVGAPLTDETYQGAFGFEDPPVGESVLSFDANGDGQPTEVKIDVKDKAEERTEVVAGVLNLSANMSGRHSKIQVEASTDELLLTDPGPQAVVSATVDDLSVASPDLVWVMETKTDARMMPFAVGGGVYSTDKVVIRAGNIKGRVKIWAQLPDKESNTLMIGISER